MKNMVTMDSIVGRNWPLTFLAGTLLWTTCLAAPMQCHFNSKALCVYEGRHFSLGESWMEDGCLQCTCLHPVGVGCCETVHHPVDFPGWCEVRVDTLTCKMTLVQSADPRLPCSPGYGHSLDPSHGSLEHYLKLAE
ncbi:prostate-associated microseminoprotein [Oncorhynchus kisutch]|uniref:prostate-associated microseminoprotein n=1 Tax=Oncorhynchus kisutch TaxID=8019 RepID=UPI00099F9638|nr:prostate-associated microseminoprotein [Oncorhynchus kisutch]XP_020347011.1 prostate-associated microseminoprotein [Oncorhynchus kisutch]XP_020347012.1 prostate-associated microseminoprotein [Oncorhynchus kisutch]XP_035639647.1 prostate-associated microseminoprotein-like [Oncorhynchus keta]